jgi:ATP-dependent DNA helicase RecQ
VLVGSGAKKIRDCGHDKLSTFGLLRQHQRDRVVAWIGQLVEAGHLTRTGGKYPVIATSSQSASVLRSETEAVLWDPPEPKIEKVRVPKKTASATDGLDDAESKLFERLRAWRRRAATDRSVPPFVIMSDAVLVEVCRVRPETVEDLRWVKGIGAKKMADFGEELVAEIHSGS